MPAAKLRASGNTDAMNSEQQIVKSEKEGQDSLDNIIRQAIGKEPFLSFSRAGDSPVQWIQLLHALDQQGSSKVSRSSMVENSLEGKGHSPDPCNGASSFAYEANGLRESIQTLKSSGKGPKSTSEQLQTLKIPEAVAAFAQAAAKANGETEKYLPGWPLLSPSKVQLQKCDKCSREFCSTINYRRHIRVHRRSLNIDKDSPKNRELLGAFWDKLSIDEAKELVSLSDVAMEEVSGSLVLRTLSSWIRKPGFSSLPQMYVKAGASLLDVVQVRPSRFPISSQELFSVLDDASEKTFLSAGTALSLQKYVFDGDAGKNALEMKNLVACTSFLLEQKLVKAWLADKDTEALRCQKLLVEEEEAAQKRQAELLERKRLKKLRQKVQKAKEFFDVDRANSKACSSDTAEGTSGSTGTPSPRTPSEPGLNASEASLNENPLLLDPVGSLDPDVDLSASSPEDADKKISHQIQTVSGHWKPVSTGQLLPKPARHASNGFHLGQVPGSNFMKHGNYRDSKTATLANGHKIWTRKSKPEDEGTNEIIGREHREQKVIFKKSEVLIGSISVTLVDGNGHHLDTTLKEKLVRADSSCSAVKLWRPVGHHGDGGSATVQSDNIDTKMNQFSAEGAKQIPSDLDPLVSGGIDGVGSDSCDDSVMLHLNDDSPGVRPFSSKAAEAFLAQRWKKAIAEDHVKLVLSPDAETLERLDTSEDSCLKMRPQSADCSGRSILASTENLMARVGIELASADTLKSKFRPKPEKSYKLTYVPKHRSNVIKK